MQEKQQQQPPTNVPFKSDKTVCLKSGIKDKTSLITIIITIIIIIVWKSHASLGFSYTNFQLNSKIELRNLTQTKSCSPMDLC